MAVRVAMTGGWNHNIQYYSWVLGAVPSRCGVGLEVGCGYGELAQQLATRCGEMVGIDLDEVPAAQGWLANLRFVTGDVMTHPWAPASFDFIACVATLHHLELEAGLDRLRELLKPGGTLAVVGLYREASVSDYALAAVALPVSRLRQWVQGYAEMNAAVQAPRETLANIRRVAERRLPGAVVRRRFFFRYSLLWRKP